MYCVYWATKDIELDPYADGYIGITKNLSERIRAHRKNKKKTPFTDALSVYDIEFYILHDKVSLEEALEYEYKYRPKESIGWNLQTGGNLGVESAWYDIPENRAKHSEATSIATKRAIAEKDSKAARSNRAKESWKKTRDKRVEAVKGERNPKALLTEAQVRTIKYHYIPTGMSNKEIAALFSVKPHVISFIRRGKNWSHI